MRSLRFAVICWFALALTASAQERSGPSQPQTERANCSYVPDLGDLMGATQLRHIKLSFAGNLKNWDLASYEVAQIRKSFEAAAKFYPEFQDVPLAKLVADVSEPALKEIDQSIKAKDGAAFLRSFRKLAEACNSCHQAAKVGFIVMQSPDRVAVQQPIVSTGAKVRINSSTLGAFQLPTLSTPTWPKPGCRQGHDDDVLPPVGLVRIQLRLSNDHGPSGLMAGLVQFLELPQLSAWPGRCTPN